VADARYARVADVKVHRRAAPLRLSVPGHRQARGFSGPFGDRAVLHTALKKAVRYSIRSRQSLLSATFVARVLHDASLEGQSCRQADHAVSS